MIAVGYGPHKSCAVEPVIIEIPCNGSWLTMLAKVGFVIGADG